MKVVEEVTVEPPDLRKAWSPMVKSSIGRVNNSVDGVKLAVGDTTGVTNYTLDFSGHRRPNRYACGGRRTILYRRRWTGTIVIG